MRIGLIACCLAFLLIGFFEGLLDMTNIMDGSGLGLLPGHTPIWIVMFFAAPPAIWCIRSLWASGGPARSFIAIPIAVVACLVFFGSGLDRSLFVLSWNHRCAHGESRACYAAARIAHDPARALALYHRACDGGDIASCHMVLEAAPDDPHACAQLAQRCASGDRWACEEVCR